MLDMDLTKRTLDTQEVHEPDSTANVSCIPNVTIQCDEDSNQLNNSAQENAEDKESQAKNSNQLNNLAQENAEDKGSQAKNFSATSVPNEGCSDKGDSTKSDKGYWSKMVSHPMFKQLQAALASACSQRFLPITLLESEPKHPGINPDETNKTDLAVEESSLQAEFQKLRELNNSKVEELEAFYKSQSAKIAQDQSTALAVSAQAHDNAACEALERRTILAYYNKQHAHLTRRVNKSLQLLKSVLNLNGNRHVHPISKNPQKIRDNREDHNISGTESSATNKKSRMLNAKAIEIMSTWYQKHTDYPYPTDKEKAEMAQKGGITLTQVRGWFSNKRNRTLNTRPRRAQLVMYHQMMNAGGLPPYLFTSAGDPVSMDDTQSESDSTPPYVDPNPFVPPHFDVTGPTPQSAHAMAHGGAHMGVPFGLAAHMTGYGGLGGLVPGGLMPGGFVPGGLMSGGYMPAL